jgi:hypothetical protein
VKKPRAPKQASETTLGVAWYRESDWPRVKSLFADADDLHDSYAEWLQAAESLVGHLGQNGVAVERYAIDLDRFSGWCSARDLNPDAAARSAYVAEMLDLDAGRGRVPSPACGRRWPAEPAG